MAVGQNRDIRDAADIQNRAVCLCPTKQPLMKDWRKRGTLAAHCHVRTAKIGDRGNSGAGRYQRCVANLHSEWSFGVRLRPKRRSVTANGGDRGRGNLGLRTVRIDVDGTYEIEDLEPGQYIVRAYIGDMADVFSDETSIFL